MENFLEHFRVFMRNRIKMFRVMKISLMFLLISVMQVSASVYSQNGSISVQFSEIELTDLFWELQESADVVFIYKSKDLAGFDKVSLNKENTSIEAILDEVLEGKNLTYSIDDKVIIIKKVEPVKETPVQKEVEQEKKTIKGTVTDADGNSLPGVSVVVKGTTNGSATDIDGKYAINFEGDNVILVFSFVGMVSQEISYNGQASQNVVLIADSEQMDEVVVVGYGTMKKRI